MKRIIVVLLILASILFSSCSNTERSSTVTFTQPTAYPDVAIANYFPLVPGAYWIYEGNVRWTLANSSDVAEKKITWKMEVVRVFERNDILGFEMRGAPWDLAWYEEGKEPSEYGIVQVGSSRFYRTTVETLRRMIDEDDLLRDLVDDRNLFLDIPLVAGKKYCDAFSIARPDSMYCWRVGERAQIEPSIKGINLSGTLTEYTISQYTLPDHSVFGFVPGVGITQYKYVHHGTISEVDVRLVEYHSGD